MHWKYRRDIPSKDFVVCFYSNTTSSFFSTFAYKYHHIVFISMLIIFHSDSFLFFILCLFLCCFILFLSVLNRTSLKNIYPCSYLIFLTSRYSKHEFYHANHEVHSMKSNNSLVNLMPHYDTRR